MSTLEPSRPSTLRRCAGVCRDQVALDARVAELRTKLTNPPDGVTGVDGPWRAGQPVTRRGPPRRGRAGGAAAALDRARAVGTPAQQHLAELRLAHVVQWQGDYGTSNLMFGHLLARATDHGAVVAAFTYQHAGMNFYDQGATTSAPRSSSPGRWPSGRSWNCPTTRSSLRGWRSPPPRRGRCRTPMIASVASVVAALSPDNAVVEVGGVGLGGLLLAPRWRGCVSASLPDWPQAWSSARTP